jgi:type I restriction enzyme R subunit
MLDVLIIGAGLSGIGAARTVDWSERESVRAKLRLMVKRILKKYKYPPDQAEVAVELVLAQAQVLGEDWAHH